MSSPNNSPHIPGINPEHIDYLISRGLYQSASLLSQEVNIDLAISFSQISKQMPSLTQAPGGFLHDWFMVFWETYLAKYSQRLQHIQSTSSASVDGHTQDLGKLSLVRNFMQVIGLGNRDPSSLTEAEKRYLTDMVKRYSTRNLDPSNQPKNLNHSHSAPSSPPVSNFMPKKRQRIDPNLPNAPNQHSYMDQMMANMLSTVIGGSLEVTPPMRGRSVDIPERNAMMKAAQSMSASQLQTSFSMPSLACDEEHRISFTPPPNTPPNNLEFASRERRNSQNEMELIFGVESPPASTMSIESQFGSNIVGMQEGRVTAGCASFEKFAYFISGGKDGKLLIWRRYLGDWKLINTINAHRQAVSGIAANGEFFVSCSLDKTLNLYKFEIDGPVHVNTLTGHTSIIQSVDISTINESIKIASIDSDGWICIWEKTHSQSIEKTATCRIPDTMTSHQQLKLSKDGMRVVVGHRNELIVMSSSTLLALQKVPLRAPVSSLAWDNQGRYLLVSLIDHCLLFNSHFELLKTSPPIVEKVCVGELVKFHNKLRVVYGSYKNIYIWDPLEAHGKTFDMIGHEGMISVVSSVEEGKFITAGHDGKIKEWFLKM